MQIGAINSVNFGHSHRECKGKDCEHTAKTPDYEQHARNVENASNDISPITCLVGIATGLAALKGGNKVVGVARRVAGKTGQAIATGSVNLAHKVKKSINIEKCTDSIKEFFDKNFLNDGIGNNDKLTARVKDVVDSIFSKKDEFGNYAEAKGQALVDKLNKNGIYLNGKSLFDNGVAAIAAYAAMDGMSDATESIIDRKKIEKSAIENLGLLMG